MPNVNYKKLHDWNVSELPSDFGINDLHEMTTEELVCTFEGFLQSINSCLCLSSIPDVTNTLTKIAYVFSFEIAVRHIAEKMCLLDYSNT